MINQTLTTRPIRLRAGTAGAFMGARASRGRVGGCWIPTGIGSATRLGGDVVPNGILLKEGET